MTLILWNMTVNITNMLHCCWLLVVHHFAFIHKINVHTLWLEFSVSKRVIVCEYSNINKPTVESAVCCWWWRWRLWICVHSSCSVIFRPMLTSHDLDLIIVRELQPDNKIIQALLSIHVCLIYRCFIRSSEINNKSSAVAEMGDRLVTIGMGPKVGRGCCGGI